MSQNVKLNYSLISSIISLVRMCFCCVVQNTMKAENGAARLLCSLMLLYCTDHFFCGDVGRACWLRLHTKEQRMKVKDRRKGVKAAE